MRAEHLKAGDYFSYETTLHKDTRYGYRGSVLATQVVVEDYQGNVMDYVSKGHEVSLVGHESIIGDESSG